VNADESKQTQGSTDECRRVQTNIGKSRQAKANADESRQVQVSKNECRQAQTNADERQVQVSKNEQVKRGLKLRFSEFQPQRQTSDTENRAQTTTSTNNECGRPAATATSDGNEQRTNE
jgi:hypothetical protein